MGVATARGARCAQQRDAIVHTRDVFEGRCRKPRLPPKPHPWDPTREGVRAAVAYHVVTSVRAAVAYHVVTSPHARPSPWPKKGHPARIFPVQRPNKSGRSSGRASLNRGLRRSQLRRELMGQQHVLLITQPPLHQHRQVPTRRHPHEPVTSEQAKYSCKRTWAGQKYQLRPLST